MRAPRQSVQKALAYFTTAVSYASKMFVKSTPGIQGHQEEGHEFNHLEKNCHFLFLSLNRKY
jgi:hypothetical protein